LIKSDEAGRCCDWGMTVAVSWPCASSLPVAVSRAAVVGLEMMEKRKVSHGCDMIRAPNTPRSRVAGPYIAINRPLAASLKGMLWKAAISPSFRLRELPNSIQRVRGPLGITGPFPDMTSFSTSLSDLLCGWSPSGHRPGRGEPACGGRVLIYSGPGVSIVVQHDYTIPVRAEKRAALLRTKPAIT
jgi:hypothetical protein